jgi:23S rRNA (uracil1939-C5)-methyltransferase
MHGFGAYEDLDTDGNEKMKENVIELSMEAMAHGGRALGRRAGKVVFVSGAIPGEVVRVRVVEERKRWMRAEIISLVEASPQRVEPPCPYFGVCGGCHFQHIRYPAQLDYKRQVVIEQLRRIGHLQTPPVLPAIGMDEPWLYRNHVQFSVDEAGRLGFMAVNSHDVIPIDRCLLLHPLLDELYVALDLDWPELTELSLRAGIHSGERMCILETADGLAPDLEVDFPLSCVLRLDDGTDVVLIGQSAYHEVLKGRRFRISAGSFFQVNTAQTEVMLDVVERYLEPGADDVLLDVYCGVGTLGLSVQDRVGRVIGVEEHPAAIADARANAGQATRATFVQGKAEAVLPGLGEHVSRAIVDPPRQGCKPAVLAEITHFNPWRIVYVSCDPATLARDALQLTADGYELIQVQPVDMFPQTYHVETISLWQR